VIDAGMANNFAFLSEYTNRRLAGDDSEPG